MRPPSGPFAGIQRGSSVFSVPTTSACATANNPASVFGPVLLPLPSVSALPNRFVTSGFRSESNTTRASMSSIVISDVASKL